MSPFILPVYGINSNVTFLVDVPEAYWIPDEAVAAGCWIRPEGNRVHVAGTLEQCDALATKYAMFVVCSVPCQAKGLPFSTAGCSSDKAWACAQGDVELPVRFVK